MSKATTLRDQSADQLNGQLHELQHNLFKLRIQSSTERLEAPSEIIKARREIARIKTILHERELGIQQAAKPKPAKKK